LRKRLEMMSHDKWMGKGTTPEASTGLGSRVMGSSGKNFGGFTSLAKHVMARKQAVTIMGIRGFIRHLKS
jgi:hypothetical protein